MKEVEMNNIFKRSKNDDFYKNLISDWGKDDVYGPWTNPKNDGNLHFYKRYYLITDNRSPIIEPFEK
jgi:hypothetical protein